LEPLQSLDFHGKYCNSLQGHTTVTLDANTAAAAAVAAAFAVLQLACSTQRHAAVITQFGVSLDWQDLRHLLLSDKAAVDAALSVGSYLKQFSKPGNELFSLRNQAASFKAAEQYAGQDAEMCKLLQQHQADCAARVAAHWREVQRKKAVTASIRSELQRLDAELSQLKRDRDSAYNEYPKGRSDRYYELNSQHSSINNLIGQKKRALAEALTAPDAVIQPIPSSEAKARQWLFFLHMPQLLQHLARASCLSQQLLLPDAVPGDTVAVTTLETYSLVTHRNECAKVATYHASSSSLQAARDGPDGSVLLRSGSPQPPSPTHSIWNNIRFNPENIDGFYSSSNGVWWPDRLSLQMGWQGSSCAADRLPCDGFFDPFAAVPSRLVVEAFTEQLGEHDESAAALQWAMPQYGSVAATAADRGNLGVCRQEEGALHNVC
jgi:hypothetical protein